MTPPTVAVQELGRDTPMPIWAEAMEANPARADLKDAWTLIELQRRRIEELEVLATKDELTGLANRRGLTTAVSLENERISRGQSPGAMLIAIDLDQFKAINDTFGHDAGDAALRAVAATLLGFIRTTDHAARIGGDEFVLLLTHTTSSQLNRRVALLDQFLNSLTIQWRGRHIALHASLGSVQLDGRTSPASLFSAADEAMYAAKRGHPKSSDAPKPAKSRARQITTSESRFAAAPSSSHPSSPERIIA